MDNNQTQLQQGAAYAGGTVLYDSKTGKLLKPGESTFVSSTLAPAPMPVSMNGVSPTMNGSLLGTAPLQTPPVVYPSTAGNALGVAVNTGVNSATNEIDALKTAPVSTTTTPTSGQSVLDQIYGLIGKKSTQGEFTQNLEEEQDILGKTQAVNDINNKILTTTKAYDDKIKEIQKNSQGKFGGAVDSDVSNMNQLKNADLANLSIIKATTLGDLETAQNYIDSKVAAEFEPIEAQLDMLSQFYQLDPSLGATDKMELEQQYADMDALKNAYSDTLTTAAKNGAPASILKAIDAAVKVEGATPADIIAAAGPYYQDKTTGTGSSKVVSSGTLQLSQGDIDEGVQKLNASRGPDGYVDPFVYSDMFTFWTQNGGDIIDFFKYYPVKNYVNPEAATIEAIPDIIKAYLPNQSRDI